MHIRFALCADEKMNAEIYKIWHGQKHGDWDGSGGRASDRLYFDFSDLSLQKNQTVDEGIVAQTIFLRKR